MNLFTIAIIVLAVYYCGQLVGVLFDGWCEDSRYKALVRHDHPSQLAIRQIATPVSASRLRR